MAPQGASPGTGALGRERGTRVLVGALGDGGESRRTPGGGGLANRSSAAPKEAEQGHRWGSGEAPGRRRVSTDSHHQQQPWGQARHSRLPCRPQSRERSGSQAGTAAQTFSLRHRFMGLSTNKERRGEKPLRRAVSREKAGADAGRRGPGEVGGRWPRGHTQVEGSVPRGSGFQDGEWSIVSFPYMQNPSRPPRPPKRKVGRVLTTEAVASMVRQSAEPSVSPATPLCPQDLKVNSGWRGTDRSPRRGHARGRAAVLLPVLESPPVLVPSGPALSDERTGLGEMWPWPSAVSGTRCPAGGLTATPCEHRARVG